MNEAFTAEKLPDEIRSRITGRSYPADDSGAQIGYDDLRYLHVLHYGFDGGVKEGELICSRRIAEDMLSVFKELFAAGYQIEKIRLVDEYGADDETSMSDNNTSAFNYRTIYGTDTLSNHSFGLAIDINPLYNPYISTRTGTTVIQPANSVPYTDRSVEFPHKITHDDICFQTFIKYGFEWGGDWAENKDYQHFEKHPDR